MTLHAQPLIPGVGPFVGDVAASVFWDITHDDLAVGPVMKPFYSWTGDPRSTQH